MRRIFNKKFPKRLAALNKFLSTALLTLELVPIPTDESISESQVRDADDRPILRAAIEAKADVLLTGDKDFWGIRFGNPQNSITGRIYQHDINRLDFCSCILK